MAFELDMAGYMALGALQKDFNRWLDHEGLTEQYITWLRFDEGFVEAECVVQPPRGEKGEIIKEHRRLPVSTPPPVLVLQALGMWRYDGQADG